MARWLQRLREFQAQGSTTSASSNTSIIPEGSPEEEAPAAASDPEVVWRVAALRSQIPEHGAIGHLVVRPESPTINMLHHCATCGDPLAEGRRYRCILCQHAVWLAINTPVEANNSVVQENEARRSA